jgi:hypothetical protein
MAFSEVGSVLYAADYGVNDYFGVGVALNDSATIMAVGARGWEGSLTDQGGVYLYDWSGSAWVQRGSALTAADAASSDTFGAAVALNAAGTMLAVGADGRNGQRGGVYIYDWSGSSWVQRGAVLTAADAATADFFGGAVALSSDGTVLVVGARNWEGSLTNQGGVYTYDYTGGAWVQRGSVLVASDPGGNDYYATSVSLNAAGTVLVVGSTVRDNYGGVYIYDWSGSAWVQRGSVLQSSALGTYHYFGSAVALDGTADRLAVGSMLYTSWGTNQGCVEIFDWSGSAWVLAQLITASDRATSDYFGASVALSVEGAVLAVGAQNHESFGLSTNNYGGVYRLYDPSGVSGTATAPIAVTVLDVAAIVAPITVTVNANTGTATAPMAVDVAALGAASAPITVGVVDTTSTTHWGARVILAGFDISFRLVGQVSVNAEEGSARVAEFVYAPTAGVIAPITWTGASVSIDLLRVIGGSGVPSRIFTGRVDIAQFDVVTGFVRFACTDDLQNRIANLTKGQIDSLCAGRYSTAVHGTIDDNWDYAQARMESRAASLDAGAMGGLRVSNWAGAPSYGTFTDGSFYDGSVSLDMPRRIDLINRVDVAFEYRYHVCRQRVAYVGWNTTIIGTPAFECAYQQPTQSEIESALASSGWMVASSGFEAGWAYVTTATPGGETGTWYVDVPGENQIGGMSAHLVQRHAQTVTESHQLTVVAPESVSANGSLPHPLRGALASTWSPTEWEDDLTVTTPDASAGTVPYSEDASRADADAAVLCLLDMAKVKILGSHRHARVSFSVPCLPEIDLTHSATLATARIDAAGKVSLIEHRLDLDSGAATTRITLSLSGVAAGGIISESSLTPPAAPDVDETLPDDPWAMYVPALGNYYGALAGSVYNPSLSGYFMNAVNSMTLVKSDFSKSITVEAPQVPANAFPFTGFRLIMPGVANSHRNPTTIPVEASYDVNIPADALTIEV